MRENYAKKLIPRARKMLPSRLRLPDTTPHVSFSAAPAGHAYRELWYEFLQYLPLRVRRQCPLEGYIADFYIHEHCLIIEVDGLSHFTEEARA